MLKGARKLNLAFVNIIFYVENVKLMAVSVASKLINYWTYFFSFQGCCVNDCTMITNETMMTIEVFSEIFHSPGGCRRSGPHQTTRCLH